MQELQGRDPGLRGGRRGGAGFRLSLRRSRGAARPAHETALFVLHGDETAATAEFHRFREAHDEAVRLCLADDPSGFERLDECARDPLGAVYAPFYRTLEARRAEDLSIVAV